MADTGKQSPLGINVLGGILKNDCLQINKNAEFFMGKSKNNSYYVPGKLVLGESGNNDSVLRLITWCINWGWHCGRGGAQSRLSNYTYNNQISIGRNKIPALGNSPPTTWYTIDPQGVWAGTTIGGSYGPTGELAKSIQWANTNGSSGLPGPANAGYSEYSNLDTGQFATWYPYNTSNPNHGITQWGWVRCLALQAWNEFNWHGKNPLQNEPQYEDFCSSFMTADAFIQSENSVIFAGVNAEDYADGTFSNLTDLMSADIAGVTRATKAFGEELKRVGNIFDPRKLDRFGFPSTLLQTLYENGAIISDLNLALGAAGLSANEINSISTGNVDYVTTTQERAIYSAFLTIRGENLLTVLSACKVKGALTSSNGLLINRIQGLAEGDDSFTGNSRFKFRTLADALDPQFLFPQTAPSLTVPIYNNTVNQATGSKFYHLIYDGDADSTTILPVNSALSGTGIRNLIGTLFTEGSPPAFTSTGDRDADSYAEAGSGQGVYSAPRGFDSYLGGPNVTIPTKLGLAAGAFRYSMLQINNITNVPPNKIGACVSMLESIAPAESAELTTSPTGGQGARPINTNLQSEIPKKLGVGSGPDGSYTHSDFFGCMSGLPYAWNDIYNAIYSTGACQPASKSVLKKNYEQLYLGNTWEKASIELSVTPFFVNVLPSLRNPPNPDYDPRPTIPNEDGDPTADPPIPPFADGGPEEIENPYFDDFKYLDAYADFVRTHYAYTIRIDDLWYRTSVGPLVDDGGGYKRGNAPLPKVVIAPNNTRAEARITAVGTNNLDATPFSKVGGIHPDKFGRVTSYTTNNGQPYKYWQGEITSPPNVDSPPTDAMVNAKLRSGPTACPSESIEVEAPPTGTYTAYYRNGKNQGGDLWRTPVGGGKATIAIYGANPWPNPGNAFCQKYIDDANAEITKIYNGTSGDNEQIFGNAQLPGLNINWDITGRQLKVEQRARYLALNCVEVPRDPFVNSYETLSTFVDSMPTFATQTLPHMASPTIEMIVDLNCPGGISAVAMMREERNADRLSHCGIPLENTIPDSATEDRNTTLLYNGTVQGAPEGIPINGTTWTNPSWPYNPGISTPESPTPTDTYVSPYVFSGTSGPGTGITPIIIGIANPQVGPYTVTGPFYPGTIPPSTPGGGGPGGVVGGGGGGGGGGTGPGTGPGGNIPVIEPTDPNFGLDGYGQGPGGPLNSVPTVNEAIEYIIHCNCDCWETITGT